MVSRPGQAKVDTLVGRILPCVQLNEDGASCLHRDTCSKSTVGKVSPARSNPQAKAQSSARRRRWLKGAVTPPPRARMVRDVLHLERGHTGSRRELRRRLLRRILAPHPPVVTRMSHNDTPLVIRSGFAHSPSYKKVRTRLEAIDEFEALVKHLEHLARDLTLNDQRLFERLCVVHDLHVDVSWAARFLQTTARELSTRNRTDRVATRAKRVYMTLLAPISRTRRGRPPRTGGVPPPEQRREILTALRRIWRDYPVDAGRGEGERPEALKAFLHRKGLPPPPRAISSKSPSRAYDELLLTTYGGSRSRLRHTPDLEAFVHA